MKRITILLSKHIMLSQNCLESSQTSHVGLELRDKSSLADAHASRIRWLIDRNYPRYFNDRARTSATFYSSRERNGCVFFFSLFLLDSQHRAPSISSLTSPRAPMISHRQLWQLAPSPGIIPASPINANR